MNTEPNQTLNLDNQAFLTLYVGAHLLQTSEYELSGDGSSRSEAAE